ncbi:flagellar L-ring protein precursor FlgH [Sphingomonas sp. OV641]|uniref:flagellar basal body L-ring protein FlgH n=1 Tax=Sphingomonas sp. OV641 TaxID=1881068 RepID=UPI0008D3B43C|nr:flagellar basal body L-ring protein FlgH [Sphingomonas sp. OV641]SEI77442.1 flagellar L-ring protein precursor FlgH [Sphingomonas sp. OV641]
MKTNVLLLLAAASTLSGCGAAGRLANVGRAPKFTAAEPMTAPYLERSIGTRTAPDRGIGASAPAMVAAAPPAQSASLFRTGAGAFFRDQRAARVGDILTIRVNIADKADIGNNTSRSRTGSENSGVAALLGVENLITKVLPGDNDPASLVKTNSTSQNSGSGTSSRSETINMTLAAVVTDVLPNGNLMVRGRQEVRVNFEMRELIVSGVVRPEDIARDNSIRHSQIAEARISYGGRGQLTDAQQARWGQQIYDALFPF